MIITDVPESGLYFQSGAVVQLVIQFIDLNSGLPVQLQTASALFIDILYPDNQGWRSFPAQLYTDGSDGQISYITANNGLGYSDLSQIGLYKMQGRATINGAAMPCSSETDFYILPNVNDQASQPVNYPILRSTNGKLWKVSIKLTGVLEIDQVNNGDNIQDVMYLVDASGQNWTLTASDDGHLVTGTVNGAVPANQRIYIVDSLRHQWVVTVLNAGNTNTN